MQAQAKIFYGEIYQNQPETKPFDASSGWLYNFLKRQKLALTSTTTTTASPQTPPVAPEILPASPHSESALTKKAYRPYLIPNNQSSTFNSDKW